MFPNVRWLFAAMLASIVVLSGGFGLFASLRVMHEPLKHLPPGAGPPQSFADNTEVPAAAAIVAPFQSRFPADSRPIIQVAADLQALRLDRGETSAPIEPPAAQQAVTADTAAQVQTAEIPDSAMALDSPTVRPASDATPDIATSDTATSDTATPNTVTSEIASIELPPDATRAVDPMEIVPLPKAAPAQTSAKAKATRPRAVAPRTVAKRAVHQRVATRTRRARRPRAHDSGEAATAAAQPAFPGQPFQDHTFQSQMPAPQNTRSQRRAGGSGPMGGPFVPATAIDPY
jgi:hypothetical protein